MWNIFVHDRLLPPLLSTSKLKGDISTDTVREYIIPEPARRFSVKSLLVLIDDVSEIGTLAS